MAILGPDFYHRPFQSSFRSARTDFGLNSYFLFSTRGWMDENKAMMDLVRDDQLDTFEAGNG